jgi:hypothetical protein
MEDRLMTAKTKLAYVSPPTERERMGTILIFCR